MPVEEPRLTQREIEILERAAEGLTNRAIAGDLGIAESTVGHHLEHVYGNWEWDRARLLLAGTSEMCAAGRSREICRGRIACYPGRHSDATISTSGPGVEPTSGPYELIS